MNVVRRIGQIIAECNEAQRRLTYRRLAYDSYLPEPDATPDTYAEFLLRTSGPSRQRAVGPPAARGPRYPLTPFPGRTGSQASLVPWLYWVVATRSRRR